MVASFFLAKTNIIKPAILLMTVAIMAGWVVSAFVYQSGADRLKNEKAEEANALLALTSKFVSTYSAIRSADINSQAPVPAAFRARATKSFNEEIHGVDDISVLMVGVPGREIKTPPGDDDLRSWITSMNESGDYQRSTRLIKINGAPVLRSVYPSIASSSGCVDCHNKIQFGSASQKTTKDPRLEHAHSTKVQYAPWQQGELMGAFVIDRQMSSSLAQIYRSALVSGFIAAVLLFAVGLPLISLRLKHKSATELLEGALDALDDPFVVYDANNRLVKHNRAFADLLPDKDADSTPGTHLDEIQTHLYQAQTGELNNAPSDEWLSERHAQGTEPSFRSRPRLIRLFGSRWYNRTIRTLGSGHLLEFYTDVTNLKTREQDLQASQRRLKDSEDQARRTAMVAEHANDAVVITDALGSCVWVNKAFTDLTGYSSHEVIGISPGQLLQGAQTDAKVVRELSEAIHAGERIRRELINYSKDQKPYWIELDIVPVCNPDGDLNNFIAIERDITEKRQLDNEREESRLKAEAASRSKSAFLANMSHEIRTPMNGVLAMAELLMETKLDKEQRLFAQTISDSGTSLLRIINDVLDFSKIEAGRLELDPVPFDLRHALKDVINLLSIGAEEKGVSVTLDYAESIPGHFVGDVGRLRQVVTNIVGNAVKFTLKGHVTLRVSMSQAVTPDGLASLKISVIDSGIGIEPEKLSTVFGEFEQVDAEVNRQFEGTGLGLAISKRLVEMMDGTIDVESTLGEGSVFTVQVRLPVSNASVVQEILADVDVVEETEPQTTDGTSATAPSIDPQATVLIIEDNRTNQLVIRKMLKKQPLDIVIANNGYEGVEAYQQLLPSLVFMDISMPVMNGFEATAAIRSFEHSLGREACPIIALTANAMRGDKEKCLEAGMDDYLSKPVVKKRLLDKIEQWLDNDAKVSAA